MSTSRSKAIARGPRAGASDVLAPNATAPLALLLSLAALAAVRAWTAAPGSMAGWGFSLLRFATPALGWTLWVVSVLALAPPLARPAAAMLARVRVPAWVFAALLAAVVWAWPDRLHFVGDFLLREGTAARGLEPAGLFPQALPLDVMLHYSLPRGLAGLGIQTAITARTLGALEAAALAWLAAAFARALRAEGVAALAIPVIVVGGGFLGIYTGYDKAIAEITLLTMATAVFVLRAMADSRWLVGAGLTTAFGLVLHRSMLALVPVAALGFGLALRRDPAGWRRWTIRIAIALPLLTLVVMLPRIIHAMRQFDPVHFTPLEGPAAGGPWRSLWSGSRWLDLINLVTLVSPLSLALPLLLILERRAFASPTAWILAALAAPWLALTVAIHPPQGMFRDWDNYSAAGVCLSMVAAWRVGEVARASAWRWLALTAAIAAAAPTLTWLAINADVDRGLARVEAYVSEPPRRSDAERARVWDFLGIRNAQLGRWDASAEAMAHAAETSPSPRVLLQWALAEQARGRSRVARDVFRRVTQMKPDDERAWYGLAAESWNLGDYDECRRAAERLRQVNPASPEARQLLGDLDQVEKQVGPSSR